MGVLASLTQFLLSLIDNSLSWFFGGGLELIFFAFELRGRFGNLDGWIYSGDDLYWDCNTFRTCGVRKIEAAAVGAFSLLGLSTSAGLAIAFVSHFISIFFTGLIGMYGIFNGGKSITGLYQQLRNMSIFPSKP